MYILIRSIRASTQSLQSVEWPVDFGESASIATAMERSIRDASSWWHSGIRSNESIMPGNNSTKWEGLHCIFTFQITIQSLYRIHSKQVNPKYESTYVFPNDFPALLENTPSPPPSDDPLFQIGDAKGVCRVMCFHPKLNKTLPVMSSIEIERVIAEYALECYHFDNLDHLSQFKSIKSFNLLIFISLTWQMD